MEHKGEGDKNGNQKNPQKIVTVTDAHGNKRTR